MKPFFGYIRVSTVKQGRQGVSLTEQRAAIDTYAQRAGLQVVEWFEETETAAKRGRPLFTQMIKRLRQNEVAGVIIHKVDRSARNLRDWADLGELIDSGIDVRFANESLDLTSRGGRLTADIQAVVAADYIRNLREEAKKGIYGRLKQGLYPGPAPPGYLDRGRGKPKVIDPVKGPLVRRAFDLYGSGGLNLVDLVERATALGLKNRNGGTLSKNGLWMILRNPFYTGVIRFKGQIFDGIHEPLISASLFKRVQGILDGKSNRRAQTHQFAFRRLLTCTHCKYSLVAERQKGKVYYRCHTRSCPTTGIREERVSDALVPILRRLCFSEWERSFLRGKVRKLRSDWEQERQQQQRSLRIRLAEIEERLVRLTDGVLDGLIDKELFEERKTALLMERREKEELVAAVERGDDSVADRIEKFLEHAETAYPRYESGTDVEKRRILEIVTSNRRVNGKNVELELRIPFRIMADRYNGSDGSPTQDRVRTVGRWFRWLSNWSEDQPSSSIRSPDNNPKERPAGKPEERGSMAA